MLNQRKIKYSLVLVLLSVFSINVVSASEKDFEIALTKGTYAMETESYAEAIDYLKQAHNLQPDNTETLLLLGISCSRDERYAEARKYLLDGLRKDPDSWQVKFELGIVLYHQNEFEEAGDFFQQIMESDADEKSKEIAGQYLVAISSGGSASADKWSLNLFLGGEHDDNVILEPENPVAVLDEDDWRWIAIVESNWTFLETSSLKLETGYLFYQSLHDSLDDFDIQQHNLSLGSEYDFKGPLLMNLDYVLSHATVGQEEYSIVNTIESGFLLTHSPRFATTLHYTHEFQNYINDPELFSTNSYRSGDEGIVSLSEEVSLNKKTSLNFGYALNTKNADKNYWSSTGHSGFLELSAQTGRLWFAVDCVYTDTEYDDFWPDYTVERKDKTQEYGLVMVWSVTDWLTLNLTEKYTINDSNIGETDYTRNVIGISAGVTI